VSRLDTGQRRLLALAVASQASISIALWGLGALGPELREEFGLSAAALGALLAAGFIGNAVILIPAGTLVDRIGPRRPLIVGGLTSGVVLVAAGLAPSPELVGVALFGYGLTAAFVSIAGTVSVFHGFHADRRGMALGVRQMAVSAGGLAAAGLLPGLAAVGGVRLSLIVSGVLAAVFALLFGFASPSGALHSASSTGRRIDLRGLLATPGIGWVIAISAVHVTALTAALNFAVPAVVDDGASTVVGAALFGVISGSAIVGRLAWGRVADASGGARRRATLRDVGLVTVVGALLYWAAGPIGPAAQLPAMAVFAFGAMGANGILYLIAGELTGPARAGQAVGLVSMTLFGWSALMSPVLGALADHAGFAVLWPLSALLAVGTVALTFGLKPDVRAVRSGATLSADP
jgi:MFS family permease